MKSKALPVAVAAMLAAACGGAPSTRHLSADRPGQHTAEAAGPTSDATVSPGAGPSLGVTSNSWARASSIATGTTTSGSTSHSGGSATAPTRHTPSPSNAPSTGTCPDPRYCADYYLDQGDPSWPRNNSGIATIHYRINPSHAGTPTQLTDSQIVTAVEQLAQVWMTADPSVELVYDGQTTDQPVNFNNVVGFTAAAGNAAVNIPLTFSSDGKTITGFDIQLAPQVTWEWQPCDGASSPCGPYPGKGLDIGASLAHAWGHVLGLGDLAASQDEYLTDFGGIGGAYPDCGGNTTGMVCRFAATLGLGDILGARYLYPTSVAMPTIAYDT